MPLIGQTRLRLLLTGKRRSVLRQQHREYASSSRQHAFMDGYNGGNPAPPANAPRHGQRRGVEPVTGFADGNGRDQPPFMKTVQASGAKMAALPVRANEGRRRQKAQQQANHPS
jgi:hypothetical protein